MLNINENAWGDPYTDWKASQSSYLDSNFQFFGSTSGNSWDWLRSNGYQQINEETLDYSIAPWRISKDSALVNITGWYWFNDYMIDPDNPNNDDRYNAHVNGFSLLKEKYNVPFILNYKGSTNNGAPWTGYYGYYFDGDRTAVRLNTSKPVVNFRYDKIKVCPVFWFTASDVSRGTITPTKTQIGGFPSWSDISSTPYCIGVGFRIYVDKQGVWTEVPLTPAIDTHFAENETPCEITGWFCEDGMKLLREPYASNSSGTHYNNWFYGTPASFSLTWEGGQTGGWNHGDLIAKASSFRRPDSTWSSSMDIGRGQITSGQVSRFDDIVERTDGVAADGNGVRGYYFAKLSEDIFDTWVEDVKKQLAFIGLPFILDIDYLTADFDSDNLYLPVFDSQRCTTGEYKHGEDNATLLNYDWKWIYELDPLPDDIPPTPPIPPEPVDSGDLDNSSLRGLGYKGSNRYYLLTQSQLDTCLAAINTHYTNDADTTQLDLDFKGSNPMSYVVGLYGVPLEFKGVTITSGVDLSIGPITIDTIQAANEISFDTNPIVLDFGSVNVPKYYNDFRDYAPYTTLELYIPLCGTVALDAALYVGHSVQVQALLDIQTGAVTARILRDGKTITDTINGTAFVQIPITGENMGAYQNNQHQLEMAYISTYIRGMSGAVSGITNSASGAIMASETGVPTGGSGIMSTLGGGAQMFVDMANIEYMQQHTQPTPFSTGSASSANAVNFYPKAILFIKRPVMLTGYDATGYGKTVGYATCENRLIGSYTGFIKCANVDLQGIGATSEEVKAIQNALVNGVYV